RSARLARGAGLSRSAGRASVLRTGRARRRRRSSLRARLGAGILGLQRSLGRGHLVLPALRGLRLGGAALGLERLPVGLAERLLGTARLLRTGRAHNAWGRMAPGPRSDRPPRRRANVLGR